jgi:transposase
MAFKSEYQNGATSVQFLKKVLAAHPRKNVLLIWDNAPWHRSKVMKEFLETCSNLRLMNFPPYAPDQNPHNTYGKLAELK